MTKSPGLFRWPVLLLFLAQSLACSLSSIPPTLTPEPTVTPSPTYTPTATLTPTATYTPTPTPSITPTPEPTLDLNAMETANEIVVGSDVECVMRAEWLPSHVIPEGESVLVYTSRVTQEGPRTHVVQSGQTLSGIALIYSMTVDELATLNQITNAASIFEGQAIKLEPEPTPVPTPEIRALPPAITGLTLTPPNFFEGETACIEITTASASRLTGDFLGQKVRVISNAARTRHMILIGIPVFTEPGMVPLTLDVLFSNGTEMVLIFDQRVMSGRYQRQRIELSEYQQTLLDQATEESERAIIADLTSHLTPDRYYNAPMILPSDAQINGTFGLRRSYNGSDFDRYHSGVDFAAVPDAPVRAAAPGKVILAEALTVRGNTVIIDHGWGIFSLYAHQRELKVKAGDLVESGTTIGTVGSSGRSTGPHLHWEIWVNGVLVNPMQWVR